MRRAGWCVALWWIAALVSPAHAEAQPNDTTAVEYFAAEGPLARAGVSFYGDVRLRWDEVRDRPGVSDDLGLKRLMLRWGLIRAPVGSPLRMEFGLAGLRSYGVFFGSDASSPWVPVLNQELNDFAIDRLVAVFSSQQQALSVSVGRQRSVKSSTTNARRTPSLVMNERGWLIERLRGGARSPEETLPAAMPLDTPLDAYRDGVRPEWIEHAGPLTLG